MIEEDILVWGRRPVEEALRASALRSLLLVRTDRESSALRAIRDMALTAGVSVRDIGSTELDQLTQGQTSQGVAGRARVRFFSHVRALIDAVPAGSTPLLLALDQIQDPHNVGALLRTADAAGVHGVLFPERHSAPIAGVVAKSSAGALHHVRLARVSNLATTLTELTQQGVWVAGLSEEGDSSLYDADLRIPLCLVVGGEGTGLRRLTCERCDFLLRLPMHGAVSSLNVSVAGAVALFEAVRQRGLSDSR